MSYEQIFIGGTTAALCAAGLWNEGWFLEETTKGRRLVAWFGDGRAAWVLRLLMTVGIGFGLLLAAGVLNPVRW